MDRAFGLAHSLGDFARRQPDEMTENEHVPLFFRKGGQRPHERAEPIGVADPDAWRSRLRDVIEHDVRPAMALYRDTIRDRVRPVARRDSSVASLTRCASPPDSVVAGWPRWT